MKTFQSDPGAWIPSDSIWDNVFTGTGITKIEITPDDGVTVYFKESGDEPWSAVEFERGSLLRDYLEAIENLNFQ